MPHPVHRCARSILTALAAGAACVLAASAAAAAPHNVVIFVADGLRYGAVNATDAPAMQAVREEGVDFTDSHALFPTLTTPNASAIATGHYLGDTGDFANSIYAGRPPLSGAFLSLTPFLEDDAVLGAMNARFGGNYLGETSLLQAAAAAGFQTAAIGKLGPTAIQAVTSRTGSPTLVIDDATGSPEGLPIPKAVAAAIARAGLDPATPDRGLNTDPGTFEMAGVTVPNRQQQDWFAKVATEVVLPRFAASQRPFVLVFWSRDPDGTQHNEGDSLNRLSPGIDGPTVRAAVRDADDDLARLRAALKRLGLEKTTDIVVTADHGFSTISKESRTSPSAKQDYPDVPKGFLPPGFLALDLGRALGLKVFEPNGLDLTSLGHPKRANAILGEDAAHPRVLIGANGGSDALWLAGTGKAALARRVVAALVRQDYTAAVFVDDALGPVPGALPMSAIALVGSARTPRPSILVSFTSGPIPGCVGAGELCAFDVADTDLQQGQGIHGAFSRADTRNMMAAAGPDFRARYADPAPVANADWAPTLAHILGLRVGGAGTLSGRVMGEALAGGTDAKPPATRRLASSPAQGGFRTVLDEEVGPGGVIYRPAAGAPGRVVGP